MRRTIVVLLVGLAVCLTSAVPLRGADAVTITYPYLGVTHITRIGSPPEFPRNVKIHVVTIDLTTPSLSFEFTAHAGTRDTLRETTLQYLTSVGAQIAVNGSFFLPFPSPDLNSALVGFAASKGNVYSPFELPTQNYALLRDSPAINIDPDNHASIVHRDPAFSDGTCYGLCQAVDGLHVLENAIVWNAFSGSAQIVTNGVTTIPCYVDATHPDCGLVGPGPANYSNNNSWYELINARTAIGITCDNKTLVLFTVDNAGGSAGMRVSEVANLLIRDYSVCNALNMDGGGSTSLAMVDPVTGTGALVNSSSDNPNGRANASGLAIFAARDTEAPESSAQIMPPPNANGWNNSSVAVTLRATDNPGGIVKQIEYSLSGAQSSPSQTVQGNTAVVDLDAEGVTQVHFAATDVAGNTEASKTLTIRIDKTAPLISGLSAAGCTLWPPNRKLVQVATVTAADALSGVAPDALAISGASNEPAGADGPDVIADRDDRGALVVAVRADRLGKGTGRIYTLRATVSDLAGNAATTTGTCVVPHDQGK